VNLVDSQTSLAAFKKWFGKSKVVDADGSPLVVYHGTSSGGFSVFDLSKIDKHHSGFFFASNRKVAESYGEGPELPSLTAGLPTLKTLADVRRFTRSPQNLFGGWRLSLLESKQILEEDDEETYTGMEAKVVTAYTLYWSSINHVGSTVDIVSYEMSPGRVVEAARYAVDLGGPMRPGVYSVYLRLRKPLIVDGKGATWNSIPYRGGLYSTDQLSGIALEMGRDGLIMRNIYDSFVAQSAGLSDVFVVFDSRNIKSATANSGSFSAKSSDIRLNPKRGRR
jgi:hypothetical protein